MSASECAICETADSCARVQERATELREKERETYEEAHADTASATQGVADAISDISGSKAFVQIKDKVNSRGIVQPNTRRSCAHSCGQSPDLGAVHEMGVVLATLLRLHSIACVHHPSPNSIPELHCTFRDSCRKV